MSKIIAEQCNQLSIFKLKEWGCLNNGWLQNRMITWTDGWGNMSKINISIDLQNNSNWNIELNYKIRNGSDEEWTSVKHQYPIVFTPCQYGGFRYWFICSIYHNGVYCGRRVAKLYLGGGSNYFACRHCYNLSYRSQTGGTYSEEEIDKIYSSIRKWQYRGKPTRKVLRCKRMQNSINNNWTNFINKLAKKISK